MPRLNHPRAIAGLVGFYSRLPVGDFADHTTPLAARIWLLPAASVVVALPAALVLLAASTLWSSALFVAALCALALIITTGGLHEDGLADCADGFWGGATVDRRLEIMRDSRIGTYGVLALVGAFVLKVALLQAALGLGAWQAAALFVAAAVAARTVALYPWVGLPPARTDGLAVAAGRPTSTAFRKAVVLGALITAALTVWISPFGFFLAALGAAGAAKLVASLAERKINGHTGDVIGCAVIVADIAYLAAFLLWLDL
ncbi:MAG: adenosylcobinamide-GDP ribazoletransferase [Pseudomonadota bacterium]